MTELALLRFLFFGEFDLELLLAIGVSGVGTDGAREPEEMHGVGLEVLLQVLDAECSHQFGELRGHKEVVELVEGGGVRVAEFAQEVAIGF